MGMIHTQGYHHSETETMFPALKRQKGGEKAPLGAAFSTSFNMQ